MPKDNYKLLRHRAKALLDKRIREAEAEYKRSLDAIERVGATVRSTSIGPITMIPGLRPAYALASAWTVRYSGRCHHSPSWMVKGEHMAVSYLVTLDLRAIAARLTRQSGCKHSDADARDWLRRRGLTLRPDGWLCEGANLLEFAPGEVKGSRQIA
jgi:hypothetical protein